MPVHVVCELARAATTDGVECSELSKLAGLGSRGLYPANEHRDFRRLQARKRGRDKLEPQYLTLTLQREGGEGVHDVLTPVLAPYEILHHLYNAGPEVFEKAMLSPRVTLNDYWRSFFADPTSDVGEHPLASSPEEWSSSIPLLFFTGGAELFKSSAAEGVHKKNIGEICKRMCGAQVRRSGQSNASSAPWVCSIGRLNRAQGSKRKL